MSLRVEHFSLAAETNVTNPAFLCKCKKMLKISDKMLQILAFLERSVISRSLMGRSAPATAHSGAAQAGERNDLKLSIVRNVTTVRQMRNEQRARAANQFAQSSPAAVTRLRPE